MPSFRGRVWIAIVIITVILWSLVLSGCKAKTNTIETHSTDTIYRSKVITIDNPQLSEIVIDNICDSLGNLKVINYISSSNNTQTTLKSDNNSLILSVNIDSIVNSKVNEYKSSLKTEKEVIVKEVKRPFNWYLLFYSIAATLFILRKPLLKLILPV